MAQPDYSRYLESVYEGSRWEVERSPHGSINATHRAIKAAGDAGPPSLVLKHASPFFQYDDVVQTFSLNRQVRMLYSISSELEKANIAKSCC